MVRFLSSTSLYNDPIIPGSPIEGENISAMVKMMFIRVAVVSFFKS